jgi:single-strand DNA-binding protein
MSINSVVLVGRLTKEIELKYTPNGVALANYTIAINRTFTNQNGEKEADFINCVSFKKQAENMANFLKKGSLIGVTGRIQTRNYDGQDGKRVYITEVLAENVQFLEPRGANTGANEQLNTNTPPNNQTSNTGQNTPSNDPFANSGQIEINDDDLPF